MEKLNRNAKAKLNEVFNVYGGDVMIAFEKLVDAKFELMEGKRENYADEWEVIRTMELTSPELSDIMAYSDFYVTTILEENAQFDKEFEAAQIEAAQIEKMHGKKAQAEGTQVERIFTNTVSLMRTAAESIGLTYNKIWDGKHDIHTIGKYQAKSTAALYEKIKSDVQKYGDREILKNAVSAKHRLPMFKIVEVN